MRETYLEGVDGLTLTMKRCADCRGRFGLIRYTAYRAFGSIIQFCCKKCERAYFDKRRKEAQSSRYRDSGGASSRHTAQ
jgi:hypothetical protein